MPLYVFCGQQLLCAYLRPSRIDGAKHAAAILKLLVKRLRQKWPQVRIVFHADSGFCRQRTINYCQRAGVHYIIGLARNARLQNITEFLELAMNDRFEQSGLKQREVGEFAYAAKSWTTQRRVITRLEYGEQGNNPRYVVTNLRGDPETLYDGLYCLEISELIGVNIGPILLGKEIRKHPVRPPLAKTMERCMLSLSRFLNTPPPRSSALP